MSDSSGTEATNHIAPQYKPDHGIGPFGAITIKLVIFQVKITWLPCTHLPRFLVQPYRTALCGIAGYLRGLLGPGGRQSLKSAAHDDGRRRTSARGARAIASRGARQLGLAPTNCGNRRCRNLTALDRERTGRFESSACERRGKAAIPPPSCNALHPSRSCRPPSRYNMR